MPWITPLSAPRSGSTTVATPIGSCSTGVAVGPVLATEFCGDSTTIAEIGVATLFWCTTVCPSTSVTETSIGTKKDNSVGAIDRERTTAERCDLDCLA